MLDDVLNLFLFKILYPIQDITLLLKQMKRAKVNLPLFYSSEVYMDVPVEVNCLPKCQQRLQMERTDCTSKAANIKSVNSVYGKQFLDTNLEMLNGTN